MNDRSTEIQANGERSIGRQASSPAAMPGRGWWQIVKRVARRFGEDNLSLVSAGVAFYALLGLFPALAALISVFGLVADPHQVQAQFANLKGILPNDAYSLMSQQLTGLAGGSGGQLGIGLVVAILLSVWGATRGTRSLIVALNIAYGEEDTRGLIQQNLMAFGMTLFLILVVVTAIIAVVGAPIVLGFFGPDRLVPVLIHWLRWPLLAFVAMLALAVLYRYGPARRKAQWRWLPVGSVLALGLWLVASSLFSLYVSRFADYNATYGAVGGVIILLMWLYLSALAILLGAELNAELEHQTGVDTTIGPDRPRGQRGAFVADHLPGE
jgi:membrane protein